MRVSFAHLALSGAMELSATIAESFCICSNMQMGSKRLDKISDYNRHGFDLQVTCRGCKHVGRIDSGTLSRKCYEQKRSTDMMFVSARLRCSACKSRDVSCGPLERLQRLSYPAP